jgi:RNA polymerase sigma-70 factor (ECF subfamily)
LAFIKNIPGDESDEYLVKKYRIDGDMDTLGALYNRYMDLVYGVSLKYFKNPEQAQDAVINIFEELVSKLKKYEVLNFKSWLYQLTKNHCLMNLRSKKGTVISLEDNIMHLSENNHQDDIQEKEGQFIIMEECMEQLPAEQKEAVRLFYLNEKCYKEIAEMRKLDINKVRSFIQNGRRNLKLCMEKKQHLNIKK